MPLNFSHVMQSDPELFQTIEDEVERQRAHIELIASENFVSPAVLEAMGSPLTNKYAEGYPGHRYYGGCEFVDVAENLARDRAKQIFGAEHANVQPHSGAQANIAVYFAMLEPGDTVLGMNLEPRRAPDPRQQGEHLRQVFQLHTLRRETSRPAASITTSCAAWRWNIKPKMIVAGASAYPRAIDFKRMREIADEAGSLFMVDMAHIAGSGCRGRARKPRAVRGFRDHHHAQNPARPARRHDPVQGSSTPRPSTRRSSPARRAAR